MKIFKKILTYLVIMVLAVVCALAFQLFIYPNEFAPSGLTGICTMIQHITGVSVGYLSLLINIPLAIWVFFGVSKSLALRSSVYIFTFSLALLWFEHVDLSAFAYSTDTGTSAILGPLVAGIIFGTCYCLLVRLSSNSGGMDFIASVIHKHFPRVNFFWTIFIMNVAVALMSYFVYDFHIEPVILCILYSFTSSTVTDRLTKSGRSAVRFEIVTEHPEVISDAIVNQLRHGATLLPGKGVYQGRQTNVLICVVSRGQAAVLSEIIRVTPDTFAVMSQVNQVFGDFKDRTTHSHSPMNLLDTGDADLTS